VSRYYEHKIVLDNYNKTKLRLQLKDRITSLSCVTTAEKICVTRSIVNSKRPNFTLMGAYGGVAYGPTNILKSIL